MSPISGIFFITLRSRRPVLRGGFCGSTLLRFRGESRWSQSRDGDAIARTTGWNGIGGHRTFPIFSAGDVATLRYLIIVSLCLHLVTPPRETPRYVRQIARYTFRLRQPLSFWSLCVLSATRINFANTVSTFLSRAK